MEKNELILLAKQYFFIIPENERDTTIYSAQFKELWDNYPWEAKEFYTGIPEKNVII